MLLMMKFDSTVLIVVGIADWSGEQNGRWGTLKICVALNKERAATIAKLLIATNIKKALQSKLKTCLVGL